jgi:cell division protein FtsL
MSNRKHTRKAGIPVTMWIILLIMFMAELLVYSWCRVQYVQTGYDINSATQERQRLIALQYELKVEEASLRSPERIRHLAQERGLVMPDPRQIVVLP